MVCGLAIASVVAVFYSFLAAAAVVFVVVVAVLVCQSVSQRDCVNEGCKHRQL